MLHISIRGAAVLAAVGLTAAGVSACTSSKSPHNNSSPKPASTSASTKQTPAPSSSGTGATPVPTQVANDTKLRKNVTLSSCKSVAGGWGASGTAMNPGTKPVDYTITIFFTTTSATVVSTAATHITVSPGGKEVWTVNRKFKAPPKMLCVLRGVG